MVSLPPLLSYGANTAGYGGINPYGASTGLNTGLGSTSLLGTQGLNGLDALPALGLGQNQNPLQSLFASDNTQPQQQGAMDAFMQLVMMILALLQGGGQEQPTTALGAGNEGPNLLDAIAAAAAMQQAQGAAHNAGNQPGLVNLSAGEAGEQLSQSLNAIASDPDGAKLLQAAQEKGVTIEVGDPGVAAGVGSDNSINGVTLTNPNGETKIVVRDPNNIKTLVHELVHAVSTQDGNSKDEEGIADVIGSRVANRLGGAAVGGLNGSDQEIFQKKQQYYPELGQSNSIRNTLAGLGLAVSV